MISPDIAETKDQLRRAALAGRDELDDSVRRDAALRIATLALALPALGTIEPIGAYWPIRSEVDPRPLMESLMARGQAVALSQVIHPHLSFRLWRPGDPLVRGGFGVQEPGPDAPEMFPRALLVPLAAFDRKGGRIGYGKGHFDRAIAELGAKHPLLTVGLAYASQEIPLVPTEPHDRALDFVVTEKEVIQTGS